MKFTDEELTEFRTEANDLIDEAEKSLLAIDRGEDFLKHYDSIFRAFHSIKGAAGMMELHDLQNHMHQMEDRFVEQKKASVLPKKNIDFYLRGTDATRSLLKGEAIQFSFEIQSPGAVKDITKPMVDEKIVLGKVMVIDDEPEIVNLLISMIEGEGFRAFGITDPHQALPVIEKTLPDLILSDISMPGLSGLDLVRLLSKKHPDIPIVLISGHIDKQNLMEAVNHGVYAVVEKPFQANRVIELVINAVQKHRLSKLLNQSINLIMYQFTDLDQYLVAQGKTDISKTIRRELEQITSQRRILRKLEKENR